MGEECPLTKALDFNMFYPVIEGRGISFDDHIKYLRSYF